MSQIVTKQEIRNAIINTLNNLIYRKAKLEINTNEKIVNYQFFDNRRNYHIEDVTKIQIDKALDRIYITLFYDAEHNKQCSISAEIKEKDYHDMVVDKIKEKIGKHELTIMLDNKQIYKQKI